MDPAPQIDVYKEVLTAIVQRFIALIGEPALRAARRVYGLHVEDDGSVMHYQGEGSIVMQSLVVEYMNLLGTQALALTQRAIDPALQRNPDIKLPALLS
jgi:hypothetical protein